MTLVLPSARPNLPPAAPSLVSTGVRGLCVQYEPFGESSSTSLLRIRVPRVPTSGLVFVFLSREYLDSVVLGRITPAVRGVQVSRDRVVLCFHCEPGSSAAVAIPITFERPGFVDGEVGLEGGPRVRVLQHVTP